MFELGHRSRRNRGDHSHRTGAGHGWPHHCPADDRFFDLPLNVSGESLLPRKLFGLDPAFWLNAHQASGTTWTPEFGGAAYTLVEGAAGYTLDDGVLVGVGGGDDTSILYDGTGHHQTPAAWAGLGTDDWFGVVLAKSTLVGSAILSAFNEPFGYFELQTTGSGFQWIAKADGPTTRISTVAASGLGWYFVSCAGDRDGNMIARANRVAGTIVDISGDSALNYSPAAPWTIGARSNGNIGYAGNVAFAAMWQGAGMLDSGDQQTLHEELFWRLASQWPALALGAEAPTAATRTTTKWLRKDAAGVPELFLAGGGWLCCADWTIDAGEHLELPATNRVIQSDNYGSVWMVEVGAVVATDDTPAVMKGRLADKLTLGVSGAGIYGLTGGYSASASLAAGVWLKRNDTTGVLNIRNVRGAAFGHWTVDVSGLPDQWERITRSSSLITVINEWVADGSGNAGIYYYASSGTLDIWVGNSQEETGVEASSDIITGGGTITRNADVLTYDAVGNVPEGGRRVSLDLLAVNADPLAAILLTISDGTPNNRAPQLRTEPTSGRARMFVSSGGATQADIFSTTGIVDGSVHVLEGVVRENNFHLLVDGSEEGTPDSAGTVASGPVDIDIGSNTSGGQQLVGGLISNIRIRR